MKISFGDIKYLAKKISEKFNFSVDNYGILLISLTALIYMGQLIWGFGGVQSPVTSGKVEKRGKSTRKMIKNARFCIFSSFFEAIKLFSTRKL